ncbi:protein phosphatase 2C domain-containing protein [Alteromonas sp. KUL49]|uniref:PP2C family protein-serine/threonine phosphatase n=1 Tax=Alteromonas sp. KUL49 TaxID=2480798 RepID=UPI00102F220B|nr:protein phosphatase 2C domain-containing protein [Alteromonas sp. KUL49]TAP38614.1 serine/threonine-protein phosphatase [Alteromonas sp. KUL49]GEA12552.1 serine/threonine protein phosphatase [Alteromonas sp. KUL49]
MKPLAWTSTAASHRGSIRAVNEDAFLSEPNARLWCVADGMGGHSKGDVASALIVEKLASIIHNQRSLSVASITSAIQEANTEVIELSKQLKEKVGSTVVVLFIEDDCAHILWAGDSRVYRYSNGALECLTRDHNQAEELVAHGLLARSKANSHPGSRLITRAVGTNASLQLEHITVDWHNTDQFILTSDGLNDVMEDPSIVFELANTASDTISDRLIENALNRWALDNISVINVCCTPEN